MNERPQSSHDNVDSTGDSQLLPDYANSVINQAKSESALLLNPHINEAPLDDAISSSMPLLGSNQTDTSHSAQYQYTPIFMGSNDRETSL